MPDDLIKKAIKLVHDSQYVVAFTGAGISVESGISDFRSPGGLWSRYDPEIYATWHNFLKSPEKYWTMSRELTAALLEAKPNAAHLALARLENLGKLKAIITQNIDNLHHRAGNSRILELHGNYRTVQCLDCHTRYRRVDILPRLNAGEIPPLCTECGGILRSNAVLFGQPLPQETIKEATEESLRCDLLMVIGSSLQVYPAASFPLLAKKNGSNLLIINKEPTFQDRYADLVIHRLAGATLQVIVEELERF
ncbi:MAG: NAD-dependent deacetylase [Candidatus Odinarchaeota archaeon]